MELTSFIAKKRVIQLSNGPPTAIAQARPTNASVGEPVTFNGSTSFDDQQPANELLYEWDFDYDSTTFNVDATGQVVLFNYTAPGTYTATLRVTDAGSLSDTDTVTVTVVALPTPTNTNTPTITPTSTRTPTPPSCDGQTATIYVNAQNRIVGGPDNGKVYNGRLNGTSGVDVMVGTNVDDRIDGKSGNDVICGGSGNDSLEGVAGNDQLIGEAGNDTLKGGGNNDTLTGGTGADTFNGKGGTDTATDFNPAEGDTKTSVENF